MPSSADTPRPGTEPKPFGNPPVAPQEPESDPPSVPEEDDPEIEKTEEQPS